MEIHARIIELLATCQSDTTMEDEDIVDSSVDFHAIVDDEHQTVIPLALDELNDILASLTPPDPEHGPSGFTSTRV